MQRTLFSNLRRFWRRHFQRVVSHIPVIPVLRPHLPNFLRGCIFNPTIVYILALTEFFLRAATLRIMQAADITSEDINDLINMYHEAGETVFEAILTLDTDTFEAIHVDRGTNPGLYLWMWLYTTITIVVFAGLYFFVWGWWVWLVGNSDTGVGGDMHMEVRRCLNLPSFWRGVDNRVNMCEYTAG